jgi:hypothetical protein
MTHELQSKWCELTPGKRARKACKAMITNLSLMTESTTPLVVLDRLTINTQEVQDGSRQDSTDSINPE